MKRINDRFPIFIGRDGFGGFDVLIGPLGYSATCDYDGCHDVLWRELHIFNWRVIKWTWSQ